MLRDCRYGIRKFDCRQCRAVFESVSAKPGQVFAEYNRFQIGTAIEGKISDGGKHSRVGKIQRLQIGTTVECRSAHGLQHGRNGNAEQRLTLVESVRFNGFQSGIQADRLQCRASEESRRADVGTFAQVFQRGQRFAFEKCIVRNADNTVFQFRRAEFCILRKANGPVSCINNVLLRFFPKHRLHESICSDASDRLRNDAVAVQRVIVKRCATVKRICADFLKRAIQQQDIKPGAIGKCAFLKHLQIFSGFKANQRCNAGKSIPSNNPNRIRQLYRLQNRRFGEAIVNDSNRSRLQIQLGNGLMEFLILDCNQPTVHINKVGFFVDINLGSVEGKRSDMANRSGNVHLFKRFTPIKATGADVCHRFGKGNFLQKRSSRKSGFPEGFKSAPLGKRHVLKLGKIIKSGIPDGNDALSDHNLHKLACGRKRILADGLHAVGNPNGGQCSAVESAFSDAPDILADGNLRKRAAICEAIRRYRGNSGRNIDLFQLPASLESGIPDGGYAVRNGNGLQNRAVVKRIFRNGTDIFTEDNLFYIPIPLECVFSDPGYRFSAVRGFNRYGSGSAPASLDPVFGVAVVKFIHAPGLIIPVKIQRLGPIGGLVVLSAAGCPDADLIVSNLQIRKRVRSFPCVFAENLFPLLVFHFHKIGACKIHGVPRELIVNIDFQRLRGFQPG